MTGSAFDQRSSAGSVCQDELADLARKAVERYESTVEFEENPIDGEREWRLGADAPPDDDRIRYSILAQLP